VDHHQRRACAFFYIVKALAIYFDKAPIDRNSRFDAPCHPRTERPQRSACAYYHTRSDNPLDSHSSVLCFPAAGDLTGIDRGLNFRPYLGANLYARLSDKSHVSNKTLAAAKFSGRLFKIFF
jgi:hypothetical protein